MPRIVRVLFRALTLLLFAAAVCFAQYTDIAAIDHLGGPKEFARRRQQLAQELKTGYVLLFARNVIPEASHYREDNDFFYFTGLADPGAVLLLGVVKGDATIFEPEQSARTRQVYGPNLLALAVPEREALGYKTVYPVTQLDVVLSVLLGAGKTEDVWVRLGFPDKADGARLESGFDQARLATHPYFADAMLIDLVPIRLLKQR